MKLLIYSRNFSAGAAIPDFKNYKYRSDVVFVNETHGRDIVQSINSAYAFIYMDGQKTAENLGLYAMKASVPVIATNLAAEAIYKEAALYCTMEEQSIADQMMLLYKDEILRNKQVEKGASLASRYNWADSADKLWQTISDISLD